MTPILMNDFRAQWSHHRDEVLAAVDRVGTSGWLILGSEVTDFETGAHYPKPVPDQKALDEHEHEMTLTPLPKARFFADREVSMLIHPFLSDEDVEHVVGVCNSWPA